MSNTIYDLEKAIQEKDTVTKLYLQGLQNFPIEITTFKKLEQLNISYSSITSLPPELALLPNLKSLDIDNDNKIALIHFPDELKNLQSLENIQLNNCQLTEIPSFIFELKNLTSLDVRQNQITSISPKIANLTSLTALYLSQNQLQKIPSEIGNLTNLDRLFIDYNQLQEIPDNIEHCKKLTFLRLEHNLIKTLNPKICNCTALDTFEFHHNELQSLPSEIGNLTNLHTFVVYKNQLQEIPESIKNLKKLKHLDISNNLIQTLPDFFEELTQITRLYLQKNQLTELPQSMKFLTNLHNADIGENNFSKDKLIPVMYWDSIINLGMKDTELFTILQRYKYRDYFSTVKKATNRKNSNPIYRESFYYLLKKEYSIDLPIEHLAEALKINFKPLQECTFDYIRLSYKEKLQKNPLKKGSEIVILGNISFNKTELKNRLTEHEIKYGIKIKKSTTHVILGKGITQYEGIEQEGLVFLTDIELNDFLEAKEDTYLKEADDSLKNDIKSMLLSKNEDTIALALEMLKQGGVNEDYLTALFLIFKNPALNDKIRKTARNFLEIHSSNDLKKELNSRNVIFKNWINEDVLSLNISFYVRNEPKFDKKLIGKYITEWTGNGYFYWFSQLTDMELQETVNQLLRDNSKFVLHRSYFKDLQKLLQFTTATNVNLSESYVVNIPEELKNFKHLKNLNLSDTYIKEIPDWFVEMTSLETLQISQNNIKKFPEVFTNMSNLKEIGTYKCPFMQKREEIPTCFDVSAYHITRK